MISLMSLSMVGFLIATSPSSPDDAPIPYDEPATSLTSKTFLHSREDVPRLARVDEPTAGIHVEGAAGSLLLESSRGAGFDPSFTLGARLGGEIARLFSSDENTRRVWLLELFWLRQTSNFGTSLISTQTTLDFFSLAPAYAVNLDGRHHLQLLFQVGGGVAFQQAVLRTSPKLPSKSISGIKPLLEAGAGLRWQIDLNSNQSLRLVLRADAMYVRRGYLNDILFLGCTGLSF